MNQSKVTIYSLPTCEFCRQAKDYFRQHKIAFTEVDVNSDGQAQKQMIEKSGQYGVPVIDIGGQIIVGFQKNALDVILGLS